MGDGGVMVGTRAGVGIGFALTPALSRRRRERGTEGSPAER